MTQKTWRADVPEPVCDAEPGFVELYWRAWELAWEHVREAPGLPQSPYMDEACWDDTIWIWDTCFMALFTRYAPVSFPGLASLRNFYLPLHTDRYPPGALPLRIQHLDNPPLFAWAEWQSFAFSGDLAHVRELLGEGRFLQKHFAWFDALKPGYGLPNRQSANVDLEKVGHGYHWSGVASGMDNTPRGRGRYRDILWVDALAQQGLSALCLARLADAIGEAETASVWRATHARLTAEVNARYWHPEQGIYADVNARTLEPVPVVTPAAFWPMLAEMCSPDQAAALAAHLEDERSLGGRIPWPSVARRDPDYVSSGQYWRGGIWLPTAYMGIKALDTYGYHELAARTARRLLEHMFATYREVEPHTIWEAYHPERPLPSTDKGGQQFVRPDFCGWSALGPISLFLENVLGFHTVDAVARRVEWRLTQAGRHGIRNLRFGDIRADVLAEADGRVRVASNAAFTLAVNGTERTVGPGETRFTTR